MGWLNGWGCRKSLLILGRAGAGTLYQVKIIVHYGAGTSSGIDVYCNSKCRTDFGDIRFTGSDGSTLLDYWIESKTNSDNAVIWVEVADDLGANQIIYLYYGNAGVSTTSNIKNTFIFGDDFDDGSFDTNIWASSVSGGGTVTEAGGYLTTKSLVNADAAIFRNLAAIAGQWALEYKHNPVSDAYWTLASTTQDSWTPQTGPSGTYTANRCTQIGRRVLGNLIQYGYTNTGGSWVVLAEETATGWQKFKLTRDGANFKFYREGVLKASVAISSVRDTTDPKWFGFGEWFTDYDVAEHQWDDVRLRKFVDPEPAPLTWGSEENPSKSLSCSVKVKRPFANWLSGWTFRKSIFLNGSSVGALSDYPVRLKIRYGSPDVMRGKVQFATAAINYFIVGAEDYQRHIFRAAGLWWYFYVTDAVYYQTSPNGQDGSWSNPVQLRAIALGKNDYSCLLDVSFNGTFLAYVYSEWNVSPYRLLFRMGTPQTNGTISWLAAEQTVFTGNANGVPGSPSIHLDPDNYAWIGAQRPTAAGVPGHAWMWKNSLNNGTWTNASGFPAQLSSATSNWYVAVRGFGGGKAIAVYTADETDPRNVFFRIYNGTSLEAEGTVSSSGGGGYGYTLCMVRGETNKVHLTWTNLANSVRYINYIYGTGWSSEEAVPPDVKGGWLVYHDTDFLFCMGMDSSGYYSAIRQGGSWSSVVTLFGTEEGFYANAPMSTPETSYENKIGMAYQVGSSAPFGLKLAVYGPGLTDEWREVGVGTKSQSDFDDIRITTSDGTTLCPLWREETVSGSYSVLWTKVPSIPTAGTIVYVYYGKADAPAVDDGTNTFLYYTPFDSVADWSKVLGNGTFVASGGIATLTCAASNDETIFIVTGSNYGNVAIRCRGRCTGGVGGQTLREVLLIGRRGTYFYQSQFRGDTDNMAIVDSNGWGAIATRSDVKFPDTTWVKLEMKMYSSTLKAELDERAVYYLSGTDPDYTTGSLGVRGYGEIKEYDWFLVRPFVDPEPYFGDWASEDGIGSKGLSCSCVLRGFSSKALSGTLEVRKGSSLNLSVAFLCQPTTEELTCIVVLRNLSTSNLPSSFVLRNWDSRDLPSGSILRHSTSTPFSSSFLVRNLSSGDLSSSVQIRNSSSKAIPSSFVIRKTSSKAFSSSFVLRNQSSSSLSGNFIIRKASWKALSSIVILRQMASKTLSSFLIVRNIGSLEISSSFVIRRTATKNLPSSFVIRKSAFLNFSCSTLIRHQGILNLTSSVIIRNKGSKEIPSFMRVSKGTLIDVLSASFSIRMNIVHVDVEKELQGKSEETMAW